jgi:hypothetical protein
MGLHARLRPLRLSVVDPAQRQRPQNQQQPARGPSPCAALPFAAISKSAAQAAASDPTTASLLGIAALIGSVALGVLVAFAVPALLSAARAMHEMALLMKVLRRELPDTLAVARLSGMELSDVMQEFGALGTDLTQGVRTTARTLTAAESGVREGARAVGSTLRQQVVPKAREAAELHLKETARLQHTAEVLTATKRGLQRGRALLGTVGTAAQMITVAAANRNLSELLTTGTRGLGRGGEFVDEDGQPQQPLIRGPPPHTLGEQEEGKEGM